MGKKRVKPAMTVAGKKRGAVAVPAVRELTASPLPLAGESEGAAHSVVRCANMRRDAATGNLLAAGLPLRHPRLTSLPLLTLGRAGGDRIAVVATANRLRIEPLDGYAAGYDIGAVAGSVRSIVMLAPDRGVVMTDRARYTMTLNGSGRWQLHAGDTNYPALQFETVDVMRLSADAEARKLTGTYDTRSLALNDADTDRLGLDLMRCYRELVDKTVRGGMELQPLLARYRLEGADGEVLYRSPAVIVGAPSGVQCVSELRCELSDDYGSRGVLRVAADVYRLRLRQTGVNEVEPGRVRRLVVETSLPVHPVDPAVTAANAFTRSGTNGIMLRCFLPGASVTMSSLRRVAAQQLMAMALKGDIAFRDVLTLHNPFDGDTPIDIAVPVARGAVRGLDAELEEVDKLLAATIIPLPQMVARCRVPNSFTAADGCVAGDSVVWGGITALPFSGYRVEEFVAESTPAGESHPWRAVVVTELESGSRCVATSWGETCAPLRLSPMIWSARADAVSVTATVERDGAVYKGVYPMTPDERGAGSCYCDPDGERIEPAAVDEPFAYLPDGRIAEHYPSALLVADTASPFDVERGATAGCGQVVATAAVDRRGSSWEFGYQRVYALTDDGIYLLTVTSPGSALRCNRVDRRSVASASAVAETDDDRYPLVCIASGDLTGLSRGNVATLEEGVAESAAGWDRVNKELWLAGPDGHARVKESVDGGWREVDGLKVSALRDGATGLLIDSDLGIRDTSLGEEAVSAATYTLRCDMPALDWYREGMQACSVAAQLRSGAVTGTLSVVSRTLDLPQWGIEAVMEFNGEVNAPLVMGLRGCGGPAVDITLAGEMTAGSALRELRLRIVTK
ncbi:MAG: hypothetical protein HDS61_01970 [Barnesiella sp.]|nr:hypothetical protein [Barnesiella sp.]